MMVYVATAARHLFSTKRSLIDRKPTVPRHARRGLAGVEMMWLEKCDSAIRFNYKTAERVMTEAERQRVSAVCDSENRATSSCPRREIVPGALAGGCFDYRHSARFCPPNHAPCRPAICCH